MPLLDADIAAQAPSEAKRSPAPGFALLVALVLVALGIGIFVFAPKQATETVREVVEAAQSLIKKDRPDASPTAEEDAFKPAIPIQRKLRGRESTANNPAVSTGPAEPPAARPDVSQRDLHRNVDLLPGTARVEVRDLLGEPDLKVSKLEHGHVVEHFVYISRSLNSATSVLLLDGRVSSVHTGMPSVGLSRTATKSTPGKPD